jgi:hypothetical protein
MVRPLREYFRHVVATDIHDYGFPLDQKTTFLKPHNRSVGWIITNPPFNTAEHFANWGMDHSKRGVAILVRTAFLESVRRHEKLFAPTPPTDILQFVERVPMHKGKLVKNGSTATAYCWIVWRKHAPHGTHFHWIAPCRKALERDSDYAESRG